MSAHHHHQGFDLARDGDVIVVAQRGRHVVDGIVTGILLDLVGFPFLTLFFVMGLWMLFVTVAREHSVLAAVMGIVFAGGSAGLFWLLLLVQPCLFPFQCRFRRSTNGVWAVQRKLWFLSSRWRNLGADWAIWCSPFYMRGDRGCVFFIKSGRSKRLLMNSGVFTDSKGAAQCKALRELDFLKEFFGVPGEMKRWS